MKKKVLLTVFSALFLVGLGFIFLTSDDRTNDEFENVKPLNSQTYKQQAYPQQAVNTPAQDKTSQQTVYKDTSHPEGSKPGNNYSNSLENQSVNPYLLKRQEMELERQKRLEEYRNSPEYKAMEKWKKDYERWRKRTEDEMFKAYESGDMKKFSEIRMKLIREEGAPKRPVFKDR